jgi:hypothetical protein
MEGSQNSLVELLLVGVLSGVAASLLTELVRIRYDRKDKLRERMIDAADQFATDVQRFLDTARSVIVVAQTGHPYTSQLAKARTRGESAVSSAYRILLLFDVDSAAGEAAYKAFNRVTEVLLALEREEPPGERRPDLVTADEAGKQLIDENIGFLKAAQETLARTHSERLAAGVWEALTRPGRARRR